MKYILTLTKEDPYSTHNYQSFGAVTVDVADESEAGKLSNEIMVQLRATGLLSGAERETEYFIDSEPVLAEASTAEKAVTAFTEENVQQWLDQL